MSNGWGPDWPNASTVIPPLFTMNGGWDVSRVDDKAFNAKVAAALAETDRAGPGRRCGRTSTRRPWRRSGSSRLFEKDHRLAGSKVKSASGENGSPYLGGFAQVVAVQRHVRRRLGRHCRSSRQRHITVARGPGAVRPRRARRSGCSRVGPRSSGSSVEEKRSQWAPTSSVG